VATKLLRIPENSDDAWPICRPLRKGMERLVTAYQETLLSLEELRTRMPELRRREQTLQAELTSITKQTNDRKHFSNPV
jgi:hypothetical protein